MLSIGKMMDSLEEVLGERFPGETVYRNITPSGFVRPSSMLTCGSVKMADVSAHCVEVVVAISITLFVGVDDYHNSHIDELYRRAMAVQELFAVAGLRVDDRVLHITGNVSGCNFDFAEVNLTFQYQDDRPGAVNTWPLMGEVELAMVAE